MTPITRFFVWETSLFLELSQLVIYLLPLEPHRDLVFRNLH